MVRREVRQSLVDMEEFFDILKTQNSLPSGSTALPDIPPSLAGSFPAAAAPAAANGSTHDAAALKDRLLSHSHASSSNGNSSSAPGNSSARNSSGSGSMHLDQQDLVEAALLLEEQQHPQHVQQPHTHNLGSASYDVGMPDRSVAISGLGLEVELEDVRFGYQPERQVRLCWFCSHFRQALVCVGGRSGRLQTCGHFRRLPQVCAAGKHWIKAPCRECMPACLPETRTPAQ